MSETQGTSEVTAQQGQTDNTAKTEEKRHPSKHRGLLLSLGGAPNTPHSFESVPGFFRPDCPTPVGPGCAISTEKASEYDADENLPLELVDIDEADYDKVCETVNSDLSLGRVGINKAKAESDPEVDRITEQRKSLAAAINKNTKNGDSN